MSIICAIFGHKPQEHIHTGAEYMQVQEMETDGISRRHARLYAECQRCKVEYVAGKCHLPKEKP